MPLPKWEVQRAALELVARETICDLPLGAAGMAPGLRPLDKLDEDEYPHVFIGSFVDDVTEIAWQQRETRSEVVMLLAHFLSQTDIATLADVLTARIDADATLGKVLSRELATIPDRDLRVVRFVVEHQEVV